MPASTRLRLAAVLPFALLVAGCPSTGTSGFRPAGNDLSAPAATDGSAADLAGTQPDLLVTPPDIAVPPVDLAPSDLRVPQPDLAPQPQPDLASPVPPGAVAINFIVDDTANQVFAQGDLEWKGSMLYDKVTRGVTLDNMWGGPWPPLYDDGGWDKGGHEPIGAVANDHRWGITVFGTPPAMGTQTFEYGLNDVLYQQRYGNGWIWPGPNGTFTVTAGNFATVNAVGLVIPKFGTTDLKLVIDTTKIDMNQFWDTSAVSVMGSITAWSQVKLSKDVGASTWTFVLSTVVGPGKPYPHNGLVKSGDKPEFLFLLGGAQYKDNRGVAHSNGVTASIKPAGMANWSVLPLQIAANNNTMVTIP